MKSSQILFILILFVFFGCQKNENSSSYAMAAPLQKESLNNHPGAKLVADKCYICHKPQGDHEGRLAPPMAMVKSHYLSESGTKEDFIYAILNFVKEPHIKKTKMRGAVNRFGVMPSQEFDEEEVKLIAAYLYESDLKKGHCKSGHQSKKGQNK